MATPGAEIALASSPRPIARLRVLHVIESFGRGAVENWLLRMLRVSHARRDDIDWSFYTVLPEAGALESAAASRGATIIHAAHALGQPVAFARHLRATLRDGEFDILHCHHDVVSAVYLAASAGIPLRQRIVHVHNADLHVPTSSAIKAGVLRLAFRHLCLRAATDIIGISRHTLENFVDGRHRGSRRDHVLYYGVDTAPFRAVDDRDRSRLRASWNVDDATPVVLFTGRMVWYKNPQFVVDVVDELRRTRPNVVAIFAGSGPEVETVRRRAAELGLEQQIRLLGWRDDTPALMRAADLFVFPRVEQRTNEVGPEGLGLVVVEAQAAGLPMLLSHGIPTDAVIDESLCVRLPLDAGAATWADHAARLLRQRRPDPLSAVATIEGSPFSLANGYDHLCAIYR
jgi:glycosyltransferase involved in cell wall biosynthesis